MRKYLAILALAVALTPVPPALAGVRVYVNVRPPAPIVEVRPVAPGPLHVWIPGYHRWDGHAHVWVTGRWDLPPAHYRTWVGGHWVHHPHNGWYWVEGHWRR